MKTHSKSIPAILIALCIVAITSLFNPAFAVPAPDSNGVELVYTGLKDGIPVFRLLVENAGYARFTVTIRAADGSVLYSKKLKGQQIKRFYSFAEEVKQEVATASFEVRNISANTMTVYKINTESRIINDVVVTRL